MALVSITLPCKVYITVMYAFKNKTKNTQIAVPTVTRPSKGSAKTGW